MVGVAKGDSAPPINKQAALYSIKLLARRLAAGHREEFVKVGMTEDSRTRIDRRQLLHNLKPKLSIPDIA